MLRDVSDSLKATLYDRMTSPLTGAFILSWVIFNWRFVVALLFGNESVVLRLTYIDSLNIGHWWPTFAGPALSSLLLVFAYPYLAGFAFKFTEGRRAKQRKVREKHEETFRYPAETVRSIRTGYIKREGDLFEELSRKEREIENLKSELRDLRKESLEKGPFQHSPHPSNEVQSSDETPVLRTEFDYLFSKRALAPFERQLPDLISGGVARTHLSDAESLLALGLVELVGSHYFLTPKGRRFAYYSEVAKHTK